MNLDHDWSGLLFHHRTPLEYCYPKESVPSVPLEEDGTIDSLHGAYSWLEKEVGYYPLFLAVGEEQDAIYMTGYQHQWRKNTEVNYALFSYKDMPPDGNFTDAMIWGNVILNSYPDYDIPLYLKRHLFKYSWSTTKWIKEARKDPMSAELVVPRLNLASANLISVRNNNTRKELQKRGFTQPIEIRRIPTHR
jgi:hypothetical protein